MNHGPFLDGSCMIEARFDLPIGQADGATFVLYGCRGGDPRRAAAAAGIDDDGPIARPDGQGGRPHQAATGVRSDQRRIRRVIDDQTPRAVAAVEFSVLTPTEPDRVVQDRAAFCLLDLLQPATTFRSASSVVSGSGRYL